MEKILKNKKILLVFVVLIIIIGYFLFNKPEKTEYTEVYNNKISYKIPSQVYKNSEKVSEITNQLEPNVEYFYKNAKTQMYFRMDAYYMGCTKINIKSTYKQEKLEKEILDNLKIYPVSLSKTDDTGTISGQRRKIYKMTCEVLLTRDLFADMQGYLTINTFRNNAYVMFFGSTSDSEEIGKMATTPNIDISDDIVKANSPNEKSTTKNTIKEGIYGKTIVMYKPKGEWGQPYEIYLKQTFHIEGKEAKDNIKKVAKTINYKAKINYKDNNVLINISGKYTNMDMNEYRPSLNPVLVDKDKNIIDIPVKLLFNDGENTQFYYKKPKGTYYLRLGEKAKYLYIKN